MSPISAREKLLRKHFPWARDNGVECACGAKFPFDVARDPLDPRSAWAEHTEKFIDSAERHDHTHPLVEGASIYGGVPDGMAEQSTELCKHDTVVNGVCQYCWARIIHTGETPFDAAMRRTGNDLRNITHGSMVLPTAPEPTYYSFTPVNVRIFAICEDAADPDKISQPWQVLGWIHDESQMVAWPAVLHNGIVQSVEGIIADDFADPKLSLFGTRREMSAYAADHKQHRKHRKAEK